MPKHTLPRQWKTLWANLSRASKKRVILALGAMRRRHTPEMKYRFSMLAFRLYYSRHDANALWARCHAWPMIFIWHLIWSRYVAFAKSEPTLLFSHATLLCAIFISYVGWYKHTIYGTWHAYLCQSYLFINTCALNADNALLFKRADTIAWYISYSLRARLRAQGNTSAGHRFKCDES